AVADCGGAVCHGTNAVDKTAVDADIPTVLNSNGAVPGIRARKNAGSKRLASSGQLYVTGIGYADRALIRVGVDAVGMGLDALRADGDVANVVDADGGSAFMRRSEYTVAPRAVAGG